jgi:hypothetical protein
MPRSLEDSSKILLIGFIIPVRARSSSRDLTAHAGEGDRESSHSSQRERLLCRLCPVRCYWLRLNPDLQLHMWQADFQQDIDGDERTFIQPLCSGFRVMSTTSVVKHM